MKILVLSFYYQPDLSAGSFRATALVDALRQQMPPGSTIHVVTTLPNRYRTYTVDAPKIESQKGVIVHRVTLPAHKSGMLDQSQLFLVFAWRVLGHVASEEYDVVFATSSRLMTAVLAAWIASKKKTRLYLDIRDIFVDTIKDVLPRYLAITAGPLFGILEHWAINKANKVNLVSRGFAEYFTARYRSKDFTYFTNGIDEEFVAASYVNQIDKSAKRSTVSVLYAGNIGEGQGLHAILPDLARRVSGKICFRIIGDGGRKNTLQSALARYGVENVEILPPVSRDQLIREYQDADVLFMHLNDHEAFKKVLPSKVFEYAAMGKPIWAGVAGYAAEFIRSEISNAVVFNPCDAEEAAQVYEDLVLHVSCRDDFLKKYARKNIMEKMAIDIVGMTKEE